MLRIITVLVSALALLSTGSAAHDADFWAEQPLWLGNDYYVRSLAQLDGGGLVVAGDWLRSPPSNENLSPFRQVFVQMHGEDGDMLWNLSLHAQGSAEISQVGHDSIAGNLLAVGRSWPSEGQPDMFAVSINDRGRVQWLREYREQGTQHANAVGVIAGAGAVIAGYTIPLRDVPTDADALLIRIDSEGQELWRHQTGVPGRTLYTDVIVHADGRITAAGLTHADVAGENLGMADIILQTFSPSGNLLWTRQFGSHGEDLPVRLALGSNSDIYLLGTTDGVMTNRIGSVDLFVARYSAGGDQHWIEQFGGNDEDKALALATDSSGQVFVGGVLGINTGDDQIIRSASLLAQSETGFSQLGTDRQMTGAVGGSTIVFTDDVPGLLLSVNAGEGWRLLSIPPAGSDQEQPTDSTDD